MSKGRKRKAIEPEVLVVTGKWVRKAARDPDGNEYRIVGTSRQRGCARRGGT